MQLPSVFVVIGAFIVAVAAWMLLDQPEVDIGDTPEREVIEDVYVPAPAPRAKVKPPDLDEHLPEHYQREPEPVAVSATFEARPSTIVIPSISVDNPIVSVGLNPDGSMEIPHDVKTVGWYEPTGVIPGDEGTAVIAGHVDSRSQGPGAFFDLRHLALEDEIVLEHEGIEQTWRVVARRAYDKNEIPIEDIFIDYGEPRLVLITCGGEFDRTARSYTDNTVVYAELSE